MVPWINRTNAEAMFEQIEKSDAHVLAGHLEVKGFEMMKGQVCTHGVDMKRFGQFEQVWSGHFHHPSQYGNINYLGSPYEMTWSDYQGRRGFHVFDTETRELERFDNPFQIFHKIDYDDADMTVDDVANLDLSNIHNAFIKVIVKNRTNPYIHDMFLNRLANEGAADVKSIEDSLNLESEGVEEILDETKDTKDILHSYIDSLETRADKASIKSVIDDLYNEALNL